LAFGYIQELSAGSAFSVYFRHFTIFFRLLTADGTLANLAFQHGVIGSAGTPEFLTSKYLTDIDHGEGQPENDKDDSEDIQEFHSDYVLSMVIESRENSL
jgi:hypothetical protein